MSVNGYKYVLELLSEDNRSLGQAAIKVDWEPAREWARFQALRRSPDYSSEPAIASINPIWLAGAGEPYVEGFRVSVAGGCSETAVDFGTSYFRDLATQASAHFIKQGRLKEGDRFRYVAAAFPEPAQQQNGSGRLQLVTEDVTPPLEIRSSALSEWATRAAPQGTSDAADAPVFVPSRVLEEAAVLSRESPARETGGILIGHLHRDASVPEIFLEVTAQVPARHTESDLTKLTFTAETWTEVRTAIELRRKGEIMLGWWHSHPVRDWCKECPAERQRVCRMADNFFSAHDQALHRAVFPRAFNVALVANDTPTGGITFSAFGWRNGLIDARGFHVLRDDC